MKQEPSSRGLRRQTRSPPQRSVVFSGRMSLMSLVEERLTRVITCDSCGHQNTANAQFCTACGSYLEWTGRRQPEPQRSAATVRVTPTEVSVEPGAEAACD